ncbi:hypothetical protein [Aquifex sp.]
MEYVVFIIMGFLSGFIYTINIYNRAKKGKNPLITFPLRFSLLALVLYLVGREFGPKALALFAISHVLASLSFVAYKVFESRKL